MTDLLNAVVLLANFVIIPALSYGSQLALGALGVTLIFGILRFANFAHGDLMAFGTMVTIFITWGLQSLGIGFGVLPTALLALPLAIVVTALFTIGTDIVVYRYYRRIRSAPVIFIVASVGVMFMLNGIVRILIGTEGRRFADGEKFIIHANRFKEITGLSEGLTIKSTQAITIVVAVVATVVLILACLGRLNAPLDSVPTICWRRDRRK